MAETTTDPRTVDHDGFVIGTNRAPGAFGSRPSVGGLSSVVQQDDRIGVIVGLDTDPTTNGLLLHLVWLPNAKPGKPVAQYKRVRAMRAYQDGKIDADQVPAEGLIALDAYLPEATSR